MALYLKNCLIELGSFFYFVPISGSVILALSQGWKLALVMIVLYAPTMLLQKFILVQLQAHLSRKMSEEYGAANLLSQEALNGIKTVQAYNAIDYEFKKYTAKLERVTKFGLRKAFFEGMYIRLYLRRVVLLSWSVSKNPLIYSQDSTKTR